MAGDDEYDLGPPPFDEETVKYRRKLLKKAGYGTVIARMLAESPDVDLTVALDLRAKGCDPDLAVRILT